MGPQTALRAGFGLALLVLGVAIGISYAFLRKGERSPERAGGGKLRVAIILPGPRDDHGWSEAGFQGCQLVEQKLGAQVTCLPSVSPFGSEKIIRELAAAGNDFIIGHGGEYVPALEVAAKEFPRVNFATVTSYPGNNQNLGALGFRAGEVGYLAGVVAALKSRTGKIGYVGGEIYPVTIEERVMFEKGLRAFNPAAELKVGWVESWTDTAKGRKIAEEQARWGADIFVGNADYANPAIFQVAKKAGGFAIGWYWDQYKLAPGTVVTSAIQRIPLIMLDGATLVAQGRWEGRQYKFGLVEGAQDMAPSRGLLSPEHEKAVKRVEDDIRSGRLDVTIRGDLAVLAPELPPLTWEVRRGEIVRAKT